MARTLSTMLPLGTPAPSFALPDAVRENKIVTLDDYRDARAFLVMFICNHCPFVIHVREKLFDMCRKFVDDGVAVFAINANDVQNYPADSVANMHALGREFGFNFPYLFDETQEVAKEYRAACTPDFYVFDRGRLLTYRGQMDGARPGNGLPVTGEDLSAAVYATVAGRVVNPDQMASMGCNIKWKPGHEPRY